MPRLFDDFTQQSNLGQQTEIKFDLSFRAQREISTFSNALKYRRSHFKRARFSTNCHPARRQSRREGPYAPRDHDASDRIAIAACEENFAAWIAAPDELKMSRHLC